MGRNSVRSMALLASLAVAACGETEPVLSELSETEAQALAAALMTTTFASGAGLGEPGTAPGGPQTVPFQYTASAQSEVACALGGSVAVAADLEVSGDTETAEVHVDYEMSQVHDACSFVAEDGTTFTVWGDPSLSVVLAVDDNGLGVVEWLGSVEGRVEWESGDRVGRCVALFSFSGRQEGDGALEASMEGSLCGHSFARTLSVG